MNSHHADRCSRSDFLEDLQMFTYVIRCQVEHVLIVEARNEAEARQHLQHASFSDFEHQPQAIRIDKLDTGNASFTTPRTKRGP